MADHAQGQVGADRAVGRPGPAARMAAPQTDRPRPSVLIPPVSAQPGNAAKAGEQAKPAESRPAESRPAESRGKDPGTTATAPAPAAPAPPAPAATPAQAKEPTRSEQRAQRRAQKRADKAARAQAEQASRTQASRTQGAAASVVSEAVNAPAGPRSARLYLTHIDPWSVMKQAFLLSLALAVVILVAFAALWFALDSAGVLDAITRTATDVGGASGASVGVFLSFGKVMGAALVLAGIETVLLTVMCTLFAFLYNLAVGIGGGLEVTLSEED